MATSKRPGQIRFEAWVPEDLYRAFTDHLRGTRKAWLVQAMRDEVWPPVKATEAERDG
jgi:hypothetical protein